MQDQPNIENLLRVARRSVLNCFVDHLPNELRLDALIVANIMAIAAREAEYGDTPLHEEFVRLAILYGEAPLPETVPADVMSAIDRLSHRLALDLRHGVFEQDSRRLDKVKAHLIETTLQKLRVNNPKYLKAEGLS